MTLTQRQTAIKSHSPVSKLGKTERGIRRKKGAMKKGKSYRLFHLILTATFMSKQKIQSIDYETEVTKEK